MKTLSKRILKEFGVQTSFKQLLMFCVVANVFLAVAAFSFNQYVAFATNLKEEDRLMALQAVKDAPAADYFFYEDIVSSKASYKIGEQITFFSFNDTYLPVHYYWNDRLWCDLDNDDKGYHLVGVHQDNLRVVNTPRYAPNDTSESADWDYTGRHPQDTGVCYVKHYISADLVLDDSLTRGEEVWKYQLFIGKEFRIVP